MDGDENRGRGFQWWWWFSEEIGKRSLKGVVEKKGVWEEMGEKNIGTSNRNRFRDMSPHFRSEPDPEPRLGVLDHPLGTGSSSGYIVFPARS